MPDLEPQDGDTMMMTESGLPIDHKVDAETRLTYYKLFFPFKHFFQWLNHGPTLCDDFSHRELAFTLENDAYLRYQSYQSAEAFERDVMAKNPKRWEIGPVYTANPRDRKTLRKNAFRPLSKELVFDIDLTDYDGVRTCCSGTKICTKCWQFITLSIKIMDRALTKDFGFKHILWVYSGRRGAHAWVCDKRARDLDDYRRKSIVSYLQVMAGKVQGKSVNLSRPWHPHVAESFDLLNQHFNEMILEEQDPWRSKEGVEQLLAIVSGVDKMVGKELRNMWLGDDGTDEETCILKSSAEKWKDMDTVTKRGVSKKYSGKVNRETKQDIILEYMYPRLDANVSRSLNHLLKSPFVMHPETGRVCVPIDPAKFEQFNPLEVPTVNMIIHEVEQYDKSNTDGTSKPDFAKTSLEPYMNIYHKFVKTLVKDELHQKRKRDEEKVDLEF